MGLITMSERDLHRIEVLSKVVDGRMTIVNAAHLLAISKRQSSACLIVLRSPVRRRSDTRRSVARRIIRSPAAFAIMF